MIHNRFQQTITFLTLMCCAIGLSANVVVLGSLTHTFTGKPGDVFEGVIELENPGEEPSEVRLYPTDFRYQYDGTTFYGDPKENSRSNAGWIQFSPQRLILQSKEKATVIFRIQIPDDTCLIGTYWSMIMIEPVHPIDPESFKENQFAIRSITRFGVQMRVNIMNTGTRQMKFLNVLLIKDKEKRFLQIDLENTGERRLELNLWVDLYDLDGRHQGKFNTDSFGIYPSTSLRKQIDLSEVQAGTYKALVIADGGEDALFGANYTIKIE